MDELREDPWTLPLIGAGATDETITDEVLAPLWRSSRVWRMGLLFTGMGSLGLLALILYTVAAGIGVWGNQVPVAWGFAIINFVWWIGLGHAGTFISAFLLLLDQRWRASINRTAEAMTLFAIAMAGIFPLLHLGRAWFFYWLVPYPSTMDVWPQFRGALPWDFAAILAYGTVSLLFWYMGLVPDLAAARDRAPTRRRAQVYGLFALGWKGTAREWSRHRIAYGLLAGLATPLVISVHSIVSMDFAITQIPGWHSTLFPPYFVAGAIYSGFALVLLLVIPLRRLFELRRMITERHLDVMAKLLLAMGWVMAYSYAVEVFVGWYSGEDAERHLHLVTRPFGTYALLYWAMTASVVLTPMMFYSKRLRRSEVALFGGSAVILVGMWLERFVIIVTSLSRDFLPSSWQDFLPTWVDVGILLGTISVFGFLFLLFVRWVPTVAIHEVKKTRRELAG